MTYVDFVSDEHFRECVKYVCEGYNETIHDEKWLHKYGLDVFKIIFDMGVKKLTYNQWYDTEILRRDDKTISNRIGEFHQKLLGGVSGWEDLGRGHIFDLKKTDNSVFIELKNKQRTVNSEGIEMIKQKIVNGLKEHPTSTFYWAYLIAENGLSEEKEWLSSTQKIITGSKIYELITKDPKALQKIWKVIPKVIEDVLVCNIERDPTLDNLFEKTFFRTEKI